MTNKTTIHIFSCLKFLSILLSVVFWIALSASADSVRKPNWAGDFYPKDPAMLKQMIKTLTDKAEKTPFSPPSGYHPLKALILPHAGYAYSGFTAAHASIVLKGKNYKRVVLIGPDHQVGFPGSAVTGYDYWDSPLGRITIDYYAKKLRKDKPDRFKLVPKADEQEHALEIQVPLIQTFLPEARLVPIIISHDDPDAFAKDLLSVIPLGEETTSLLIASSDLSHNLPDDEIAKKDKETIDMILHLDEQGLKTRDNSACGITPILALIHIAKLYNWKAYLIHYSNSANIGYNRNKAVGYAAIAFYGGFSMKNEAKAHPAVISKDQGKILVDLARYTISSKLGKKEKEVAVPDDPVFKSRLGTFVTLKINHELRGCIGNITPEDTIVAGVKRNALNAAFSDYRFSPLTKEELQSVDIEVSILSEAKPLAHSDGKDLISKLKPFKDGVIIRKGTAGATFLPQVWEQLPEPEKFLTHLCLKAGLPADAWTKPGLEVSTYQVQYFEESR